ncbi:Asp23/Gls24 family envelope stress response protein [Streptomyces sp. NPDC020192]|uniref:Asp23/Gls24 family envelope stress response protein n=1 Tax=Streptomyces sp. NPDC020192 TaxID=3365066 RepID=UPI00378C62BA
MSAEPGVVRPRPLLAPPGERGALRIADRVVAKIAAQAAREALPPLPADAAAPHATVVVLSHSRLRSSGGTPAEAARIRVYLELGYPCDIGAHSAAVRRQVAERVSALVDMAVPEVAVQIERLHPASAPAPGTVHGRA